MYLILVFTDSPVLSGQNCINLVIADSLTSSLGFGDFVSKRVRIILTTFSYILSSNGLRVR